MIPGEVTQVPQVNGGEAGPVPGGTVISGCASTVVEYSKVQEPSVLLLYVAYTHSWLKTSSVR